MGKSLKELLQGPLDEPSRRRWWPWIGAGAAVLVGVVVFVVAVSVRSDNPGIVAAWSTSSTIRAADLETDVVLEDPRVERGVGGPELSVPPSGAEETLDTVEGLTLVERAWFGESAEATVFLDVSRRVAVGAVSDSQYKVLAMFGTVADPYDPGFGAPGACFRLSGPEDGLVDCFGYDPPGLPRPLFVGAIGSGFMAWGLLPQDASIAVLSINGEDVAWQRPRGGTAVFRYEAQTGDRIELRHLDAASVEIGRSDRSRPAPLSGTYVEPITGYGDFSEVPDNEIDAREVSSLVVACIRDQGFAVSLLPSDATVDDRLIDTSSIPDRDRPAADLAHARCRAGLNLPNPGDGSAEGMEVDYDAMVEIHSCLVDLGYALDPPPAFQEWATTAPETRWDPIRLMELHYFDEAQQALQSCLG